MKEQKTWVLVAHRVGASFYQRIDNGKALELVKSIAYPQGKLKSGQIDSDRPGRAMGVTSRRRIAFDVEKGSQKQNERKFAKRLAQIVNRAALGRKYDKLVLVAEPHFLGLLREDLDKRSTARVVGEFRSDLGRLKTPAQARKVLSLLAR